ncbi:MAG: DUF4065 domain-containing protein [Atopobiaceae bacterium]|nr:DUF4065 domain-containing protein [Atopobiaceae bacterium]
MCMKAMDLAHYVVDKCSRDNKPVSNLQLQKILYFLQYIYCRTSNGHLIFRETFEAWPYGPVLRKAYREYSGYGGRPINKTYDDVTLPPSNIKDFVDAGIEMLREKAPWDLVKISHAPGSPWDAVYDNRRGFARTIPNELVVKAATAKVHNG